MSTKHDPKTGQIYTETTIPQQTQPKLQFTQKCLGTPPLMHSKRGTGTLQQMCERRFLNSLEMLEVESLVGVPEWVVERLEGEVFERGLDSIRTWQILTQAHPKTPPRHHKCRIKEPLLNAPLSTLPSQLDSPNLHWLTTLTISNTSIPATSMLHLASISNLVSLHITSDSSRRGGGGGGQCLDDDVFRRWSRQASTSNGFPRLQILFLRFQSGVTSHAFEFLDGFPRLRMLCTSRCGVVIKEAKKIIRTKGWKMTKLGFYAHVAKDFANPMNRNNYTRSWLPMVDRYTMQQARALGGEKPDTPLLSVYLGSGTDAGSSNESREVECYVKDEEVVEKTTEAGGSGDNEGKRKGGYSRGKEEDEKEMEEKDPKRRRIRDRKKVQLLDMLKGM